MEEKNEAKREAKREIKKWGWGRNEIRSIELLSTERSSVVEVKDEGEAGEGEENGNSV